MIDEREKVLTNRASRLIVAVTGIVGLGAAVGAAPLSAVPRADFAQPRKLEQRAGVALRTLSDAPAIHLVRATGDDEHCVAVVEARGPDGRVYATRGAMCGME